MSRRIAVRAVIVDDNGKLFCVKLKDLHTKQPLDYWCVPGGGLDEGEALKIGLHREMIEETNVAPEIGELLYVQQYGDSDREHFEFFFHVTNADDYKDIDIASASHAEEEIAEFGFVDPATTHVLPKFLATEDLTGHIKSKQTTKVFTYLQ